MTKFAEHISLYISSLPFPVFYLLVHKSNAIHHSMLFTISGFHRHPIQSSDRQASLVSE